MKKDFFDAQKAIWHLEREFKKRKKNKYDKWYEEIDKEKVDVFSILVLIIFIFIFSHVSLCAFQI